MTVKKDYRSILPALIMINIFILVFGHYYYPFITYGYTLIMLTYLIIRSFINLGTILIASWKGLQVLNKIQKKKKETNINCGSKNESRQISEPFEYKHAIIIASYNQKLELLRETLSFLSSHKQAKDRYYVYLAMEEREIDSDKKAESLI